MLAGASGFMGCAAAVIGSLWRARQNRLITTYGSSRWRSVARSERPGSSARPAFSSVALGSQYLRHDGPEHVMAFAPTRSGKGVGLVIPTLLSWTGSAVVHDIKGENWQLTAGWRSRLLPLPAFNPTDPRSARYNPLLEVRKGLDEVRDVQNIADILVDPEGALERRSHWEKTSHSLLVGRDDWSPIRRSVWAKERCGIGEESWRRGRSASLPQRREPCRMAPTSKL